MKEIFPYLVNNNKWNIQSLVKDSKVKECLSERIIYKIMEYYEGNKNICFNCEFESDHLSRNYEFINLNGINVEYLTLLLILCINVERIGLYSNSIQSILDCGIDERGMKIISQSFPFLKNVRELYLGSK